MAGRSVSDGSSLGPLGVSLLGGTAPYDCRTSPDFSLEDDVLQAKPIVNAKTTGDQELGTYRSCATILRRKEDNRKGAQVGHTFERNGRVIGNTR